MIRKSQRSQNPRRSGVQIMSSCISNYPRRQTRPGHGAFWDMPGHEGGFWCSPQIQEMNDKFIQSL